MPIIGLIGPNHIEQRVRLTEFLTMTEVKPTLKLVDGSAQCLLANLRAKLMHTRDAIDNPHKELAELFEDLLSVRGLLGDQVESTNIRKVEARIRRLRRGSDATLYRQAAEDFANCYATLCVIADRIGYDGPY